MNAPRMWRLAFLLVGVFISVPIAQPFVIQTGLLRKGHRYCGQTCQVYSLRRKAKQKLSSFKDKLRQKNSVDQLADPDASVEQCYTPLNLYYEEQPRQPNSFQNKDEKLIVNDAQSTTEVLQYFKLPRREVPYVRLPPLDPSRTMTPEETEFREKIAYFERYSERDMSLLKSKRLKVVLEGMRASPLEPAVYKAFEILYQDLYPLRVAGRLIFRRLRQVLQMCVRAREQELELLQNTTDVSSTTLEAAQFAFSKWIEITSDPTRVDDEGINNNREHDLLLPVPQFLQSTWILEDVLGRTSAEDLEAFLLNVQVNGTIDFPQLVHGLQAQCESDMDLENLLVELTRKVLMVAKDEYPRVLDPKRQDYSDRYDKMLEAVRKWKGLSASGDGRKWEILRGCCAGAENEAVREALRIVYVDHSAMRMAGNTIFALVSALIPDGKR